VSAVALAVPIAVRLNRALGTAGAAGQTG